MTTVNLFKLLDADCLIFVDHCEIDMVMDYCIDVAGNKIMRCEYSGDRDCYFRDQEVVLIAGECDAIAMREAESDDSYLVTISFKVTRPLTLEDL